LAAALTIPAVLTAQTPDARIPANTSALSLAGPRFGVTMISNDAVAKLAEKDITVSNAFSQFGWQFEKQFLGSQGSLVAISEFVALIGGLDQGVFLPSVSWLVGLRSPTGTEFGVGPNATPMGVALAVAAGVTIRSDAINVPISAAIVPSATGVRVSILTGFTKR
jgi:hypothetical protein